MRGYRFFAASRRAAQYFFILADTAFFWAADIFGRFRRGGAVSSLAAAVAARLVLSMASTRSGNCRRSDFISVWSSSYLARAPRRANSRMEEECLAIG